MTTYSSCNTNIRVSLEDAVTIHEFGAHTSKHSIEVLNSHRTIHRTEGLVWDINQNFIWLVSNSHSHKEPIDDISALLLLPTPEARLAYLDL